MSKISIVIPCYNASKYIRRCIESLTNQNYKDFSVIIINDASTDNTLEVLENIKQTSSLDITILNNEINCGPAISRNKAIEIADSEYITFCDADDWYQPNILSSYINIIEQQKADIVFCGYQIVDENNHTIKRPLLNETINSIEDALLLDVDSLCMMISKTDVMKESLLPDIRNGEDMAVIPIVISKSTKCGLISDCLYNYYRRSNSASQKPTFKVVESLEKSFLFLMQNFPEKFIYQLEYIGVRNYLYAGLITLFCISFDKKKANEMILRFEESFPNWWNNNSIKKMPSYKKISLFFIHKRWYGALYLLALFRKIATGIK